MAEGRMRIQRLFICGAHSTGKTTVVRRLAEQLPTIHAHAEVARPVIIDMGLTALVSAHHHHHHHHIYFTVIRKAKSP